MNKMMFSVQGADNLLCFCLSLCVLLPILLFGSYLVRRSVPSLCRGFGTGQSLGSLAADSRLCQVMSPGPVPTCPCISTCGPDKRLVLLGE